MANDHGLDLEFLNHFWTSDVKPPLMEALLAAPEDKLDWAPGEKMMSLGNVFMHIGETSMWWIGKIIDNMEYKDITPGPSFPRDKIRQLMEDHWHRIDGFFMRSPRIIEKSYGYTHNGKEIKYEGRWILIHLLEHDIHHRCQINQYLRILGIEPPRI